MPKKFSWQFILGSSLVVFSLSSYLVHYLVFGDSRHIALYLIGDIAFLPIQVLFVTLVVDRLLNKREKLALLKKLNMVIGVFFSEMGRSLLEIFKGFDTKAGILGKSLLPKTEWTEREFSDTAAECRAHKPSIELKPGDLEELKRFLLGKRDFLVALMENPNLLEHESFTDLLWAVFHLAEELAARPDISRLHDEDLLHIIGDIHRAYTLLLVEWTSYLAHLKSDYPYLYSLAIRMNPFDPAASPSIK